MTQQLEDARTLVLAQDVARVALVEQATSLADNAVRDFAGWYDPKQITNWTAALSRNLESIQRGLARSTDAYLARYASVATGKRMRPVGAVDVTALRRDITHPGVYGRAADSYRYQQHLLDQIALELSRGLKTGPPKLDDPLQAAANRVKTAVDLDAQLVVRNQSARFMQEQHDVLGWRRVIHPERSKGGTCGLCAAASTRMYPRGELMPIHAGCSCVPTPVLPGDDVAAEMNRVDLSQIYTDSAGTDSASLKRTRYGVSEHGELGPVLHAYGQPIRSKPRSKSSRPRSPEEKRRALEQLLEGQEQALPRVSELAKVDSGWTDYESRLKARVEDLRRQLAA
jgi:hypothetical protein